MPLPQPPEIRVPSGSLSRCAPWMLLAGKVAVAAGTLWIAYKVFFESKAVPVNKQCAGKPQKSAEEITETGRQRDRLLLAAGLTIVGVIAGLALRAGGVKGVSAMGQGLISGADRIKQVVKTGACAVGIVSLNILKSWAGGFGKRGRAGTPDRKAQEPVSGNDESAVQEDFTNDDILPFPRFGDVEGYKTLQQLVFEPLRFQGLHGMHRFPPPQVP